MREFIYWFSLSNVISEIQQKPSLSKVSTKTFPFFYVWYGNNDCDYKCRQINTKLKSYNMTVLYHSLFTNKNMNFALNNKIADFTTFFFFFVEWNANIRFHHESTGNGHTGIVVFFFYLFYLIRFFSLTYFM